ncbi:MAG: CoA pyrophosphatase [Halanaerobiales bacterium]|nr:CoA pyrophosphatase [Halanaerobiales bacterium]
MNINDITNKIKNREAMPIDIKAKYSVLLPLINVDGELHILFEVRSNDLDTQPGEISFPGGKVESGETFQDAAVRETSEELNIPIEQIEIINELDYMVSPFNLIIHCYAGLLNVEDWKKIKFNQNEVAEIFTVPLKFFIDNQPSAYPSYITVQLEEDFPYHLIPNGKDYDWRRGRYPVYFYHYKDYTIWGITAKLMKNFIDILNNDR